MLFTTDHVGSDDMEAVLEFSAREAAAAPVSTVSGSSKTINGKETPSKRQELNGEISRLEAELRDIDDQITKLKDLRAQVAADKQRLVDELQKETTSRFAASHSNALSKASGKAAVPGTINYMTEQFEWSGELKARMRDVFRIHSFRLCQQGVCNASMDGRDVVCIMPTGGGKSLTYQLPALLNPGCTLVISPLISLITDQILHLREFGVEAVMLMGSTSREESRDIYSRLAAAARSKSSGPEIKLCYVTPEKIAKSKSFTSMLEKLTSAGKLSRIVIDEAHCVSQLGHDFRPDYKKLSILRQLFPRVPILALSATCPPKVLKDLLTTLRLKPIVSGSAATADGTVYFSAPLYRKNLHYRVFPKPASGSGVIKAMAKYILDYHRDDSGIVYCMSKKDTETVSQGLAEESGGKIRTGVYHADIHERDKSTLHEHWRRGEIKVVCATIAFGLGIDKSDVRFVLHHSMSKSLEGYYQESGRAGRDGKDSDCILYFRPQDASRLTALVCGELEGQAKLKDMLRFAIDVEECRKLQFARYFSSSASLSMSVWGTEETDAYARCGHCDNCIRPVETLDRRDATLPAWQILRVAQSIERDGGRVTMGMLADLVRGAGGGAFDAISGGHGRGKGRRQGITREKVGLDLDEIAGGKVALGKDETEVLIVQLLLSGHLGESFHSTAYTINVYVTPGPGTLRLTCYSREDVESGRGQRIQATFLRRTKQSTKNGRRAVETGVGEGPRELTTRAKGRKRKRGAESLEENGDEDEEDPIMNEDDAMSLWVDDDDSRATADSVDNWKANASTSSHKPRSIRQRSETDGWAFTMADGPATSASSGLGKFKPSVTPKRRPDGLSYRPEKWIEQAADPPSNREVIQIISDSE